MESGIFQTFTSDQGYGNNRCSGYALAPIYKEIFRLQRNNTESDETQSLGEWIYDRLCACQEELLSGCPEENVSVRFVKSPFNVFNGTCMILPSSIVTYCSSLGWDVKVVCSERDVGIFGTEVFGDDCLRMERYLCLFNGYDEMLHEVSHYRYLVALTRFKHWVSLKKSDEGYYLYDPAPNEFQGGMFGPGRLEDLLPPVWEQTGSKFFNELVIGITEPQ